MYPKRCEVADLWAKNVIDPTEYLEEHGHPCNTIVTNPFGSNVFNTNSDLTEHEGIDFSSHILLI